MASRLLALIMFSLLISTTLNYVTASGQLQENEIPGFGGIQPQFTPPTDAERIPPPPPPDAMSLNNFSASSLVRENDTDADPLSVTNRTEILEILPLNSSNIIQFVDEELKNNTGIGLVPNSVLENITSRPKDQSNGNLSNTTLLGVISPEELAQIKNMTVSIGEREVLDLDEEDIPTRTPGNGTVVEEVVEELDLIPEQSPTDQQLTNDTSKSTQGKSQVSNQLPPRDFSIYQSPTNATSEITQDAPNQEDISPTNGSQNEDPCPSDKRLSTC